MAPTGTKADGENAMEFMLELLPWLLAMLVLIFASAFFSSSEAALFSLRPRDRTAMGEGGRAQRAAIHLLEDPERLLSAVLFWNLATNMIYFAIASIVGIQIERSSGSTASASFAFGALLTIIFLSEMLPKSLAVLRPRRLATLLSLPLALTVRAADPLMPVLRLSMTLSQRLLWPRFAAETYLHVSDLERAIELSTSDAKLVEQERAMLRNIVALSSIRAEEWMRPRTQFLIFRPPVSLTDLNGKMTPSGYLLVSEHDTDEVASALNLREVSELPRNHLEHLASEVGYVPWCATVGDALDNMLKSDREVVAVVNEHGESIGILTFEDVLDSVFTYNPSRSKRLLDRNPIHPLSPDVWLVAGVTSLRRLSRLLEVELPESKSVTVAGVIQETLQRLIQDGDECHWGPFHFRVLEAPQRGHAVIEMHHRRGEVRE
ncbi:CNNM domain-containing protein [Lignipirellula cremea]|uniref:Magnesium and cobalt efflux protein CorC n=1 Tax=Lignipirellula cremea TaxID=2528010 RepID=A0A518DZT5_9BACT|nr:CNNM domain-containing protein [Lignipirellula cremea]QDU97347.1 hypothetical protein Pla8534_51930 [Lignipirellula cremea]